MEIHVPGGNFLDILLDTNAAYQGPSDTVIPNASEDQLTDALTAMERGEIEYVILQDGDHFLQAAGDAKTSYSLEYNDGSDKIQYRASNTKIPGAQVADTFRAYLKRDAEWKTKFSWTQFKL